MIQMSKHAIQFRPIPAAVMLLVSLAPSGCWIPENFDAKVAINKDGSYTFSYDRTLTFALALAAAKAGKLSANDEAEFQKEASKLKQEPGFKSVEYQGRGRYKVLVEKSGKPGEPFYFVSKELQFFAVLTQVNRTLTVTAIRPKAKEMKDLNAIGANICGTLSVSVPSGVTVLKHNAQSEPSFFGLFGSYRWQIKSADADPVIVVQPAL